jgi:ribosome-binding factor A
VALSHHRHERVADRIREVLARLLREEVRDPRIGFVTLTDVRLSPDLRHARVFVSMLGGDAERRIAALRRAAAFLRRSLAREAALRFTPELQFVFDDSVAGGFRIERLLDRTREDADTEPEAEA